MGVGGSGFSAVDLTYLTKAEGGVIDLGLQGQNNYNYYYNGNNSIWCWCCSRWRTNNRRRNYRQ
jgi:hypothetical protein